MTKKQQKNEKVNPKNTGRGGFSILRAISASFVRCDTALSFVYGYNFAAIFAKLCEMADNYAGSSEAAKLKLPYGIFRFKAKNLEILTGLSHSTVARVLRQLREWEIIKTQTEAEGRFCIINNKNLFAFMDDVYSTYDEIRERNKQKGTCDPEDFKRRYNIGPDDGIPREMIAHLLDRSRSAQAEIDELNPQFDEANNELDPYEDELDYEEEREMAELEERKEREAEQAKPQRRPEAYKERKERQERPGGDYLPPEAFSGVDGRDIAPRRQRPADDEPQRSAGNDEPKHVSFAVAKQKWAERSNTITLDDGPDEAPQRRRYDVEFQRIYDVYPQHRATNYTKGLNAYIDQMRANPSYTVEKVLENLEEWMNSAEWINENGKYIPGIAKFFTDGLFKRGKRAENMAAKIKASDEAAAEAWYTDVEDIQRLKHNYELLEISGLESYGKAYFDRDNITKDNAYKWLFAYRYDEDGRYHSPFEVSDEPGPDGKYTVTKKGF